LLFSSYARAGIAAAIVSCILLCIALRRYGLLIKGLGIALLLASLVAATVPLHQGPSDSLTSSFVYKGRRDEGILASRRSVWDDAVSAIQEHPWFGSGFGTSKTSSEIVQQSRNFESLPQATREHGNSYLAITEWVGFVGDIPFFALVILIVMNVVRALGQMRRTGDAYSPVIPLAGVLAAGLVHAAFEDWLFAVGYYLCVFFWTLAFIMVDVLPALAASPLPSGVRNATWPNYFGVAATRP
jgi:O-antigen ligase